MGTGIEKNLFHILVGLFFDSFSHGFVALVKKVELLSFDHLFVILVEDLVAKSGNGILIAFDEHDGGSEVSVCKCTEDSAGPIEVIGVNSLSSRADIGRHLRDVGVKRKRYIEGIASEAKPFHCRDLFWHIWTNLKDSHDIGSADADWTVFALKRVIFSGIWVVWGSLIVRRKDVFDVFDGDLSFWDKRPWDIIALWTKVSVAAIPLIGAWVEESRHIPSAWGVIDVIGVAMGAIS